MNPAEERIEALKNWRSTLPHHADECRFEQCRVCGCCAHGQSLEAGCLLDTAPFGSQCGNYDCGCEGRA